MGDVEVTGFGVGRFDALRGCADAYQLKVCLADRWFSLGLFADVRVLAETVMVLNALPIQHEIWRLERMPPMDEWNFDVQSD